MRVIEKNHYGKKKIKPDTDKALKYVESFDFDLWAEELRKFLGKGAESMIALEEKEGKYEKKISSFDKLFNINNNNDFSCFSI